MAIDPNNINTTRVGQLADAPFSLTDQIPHEVGTDLKRGSVQSFADFLALQIGASSGISFVAVTVPDGGTLPNTTQEEWLLVGKGTFYNVNGGATIVTTEELNALISNGTFWSIGVEIPIAAELIGITEFIRSGYTTSAPSENAVFNALAEKANLDDIPSSFSSDEITNNSEVEGATVTEALDNLKDDIDSFVQTTAGVYNRINFTGDTVSITAGTFYHTDATSKGTVASVIQSVVNDDNQKKYFTQDLIGNAFPALQTFPAGIYSGHLSVRVSPNFAQQRYTVEIYKTNNGGAPIASGITGAPVGSLGVTVVAILDSGIINLADNAITSVPVSGQLLSQLSIAVGERIRYHVSAEKVGTASGAITMEVFYGSSYNSYYDVPVTFSTDNILNKSTVLGVTETEALNTLNAEKESFAIKSSDSLTGAKRKGDVLYGIIDRYTGEEITLSKVTGAPVVDGVIYFQLGSEYFKRVFDGGIDVSWFGNELNTSFRDRLVLTVSGSAIVSGNLRLVFNNIFFNISILNTDTINDILVKIKDTVYTQNDKVIIGNTLEMTNSSLGELRFSIEQIPSGLSITSSATNIDNGVVVRRLNSSALNLPNTKYIISQDFNLEGQSFEVPDNCILHFTKTGFLSNGEVKGNNTTIVLDDDGDVFNNVYFVGSYLKSSQMFNYKTMQDLKSAYKSQFPSKMCLTQGFWFKDDGGGAFYQLDTHENLTVEYAPYFDSFYNGSTWDGKFVQVNSNLSSSSCISTPYAKLIRISDSLNLAHFGIKYDANFYDSITKKWYVDSSYTVLATDNYRNFQAIMPQLRLFVSKEMPETIVISDVLIINTTVVIENSVSSFKLMNSGKDAAPNSNPQGGIVITSNSDLDVLFDFTAPGLSVVLENLSFFGCGGRIKNGMICRNGGEIEALSRLSFTSFSNAGLVWLGISSSFKIDTASFFHNKIGLLITNVNTVNNLDGEGNPTEIYDVSDRIMSGNRISGDNNSSALIQIDGLNPKGGTIYKFPLVLQLRDIKAEGVNDAVVKIVTGYTGTRIKIDGIVNYPTLTTNRCHLVQIKGSCISTPSIEIANYINFGGDITQGVDIDDELNSKKILLNDTGFKISAPHIIYTAENNDSINGFMVFRDGMPENIGTTRKSGTTAQRPTITSDANSLKINKGLCYFDTTLGIPIFVKDVTGSVIDWVRYDGTSV